MEAVAVQPSREMVDRVITDLLEGNTTIKNAVQKQGVTLSAFKWYLRKDKEAASALVDALEFRTHLWVDDTIQLADGDGDPAKVRNQILVRHWGAERYNRKQFGNQVDINVTQTVDVTATLAEARSRLVRPVRDQLEADVVDVPLKAALPVGTTQVQAPAAAPPEPPANLVPDIFS